MRRLRQATIGVVTTALATAPTMAVAQDDPSRERTFDAPERAITLSVSSDLLYDTNVAKGSDDAARLRGVRKEDFRAAPRASIDLTLPSGAALFTARGSIGYEIYTRNERLNRERIDLEAGARLPFGLCDFAPDATFTRRQNDLTDLSIDPLAPAASTVNVQTSKRIEGALACGPAVGFRPTGFIDYAATDNSAPFRRAQDVDVVGYGSGLTYANPLVGLVTAFVRRSDFTYDRRRIPGESGPARFRVVVGGARIDRRLGARLQLVGSISYADVTLPAGFGNGRDLDGINWNLAASLRAGERLLLSLDSERVIESSPGFAANFVRKTIVAGSASYALSPLVRIGISASHRARDFQLSAIQPDLAISRDTVDDVTLRLDYVRQQIRFRLDTSYQRRDADRDLYDYDGMLVSLSVSYLF